MREKPPIPPGRLASPRHKNKQSSHEYTQTLRSLSRLEIDLKKHREALAKELAFGNDRSLCVIITAIAERHLEQILLMRLHILNGESKKLFERDGALSTFYGNIHLSYSLGLITKTMRDDLDVVRRVRNAFAHAAIPISPSISFLR